MKITNLRIVVVLVICCCLPQMMSFYLSLLIMTVSYCFLHTAVSEHFLVELTIRKSIASKRKRWEKTWNAKTINCCDFFLALGKVKQNDSCTGSALGWSYLSITHVQPLLLLSNRSISELNTKWSIVNQSVIILSTFCNHHNALIVNSRTRQIWNLPCEIIIQILTPAQNLGWPPCWILIKIVKVKCGKSKNKCTWGINRL